MAVQAVALALAEPRVTEIRLLLRRLKATMAVPAHLTLGLRFIKAAGEAARPLLAQMQPAPLQAVAVTEPHHLFLEHLQRMPVAVARQGIAAPALPVLRRERAVRAAAVTAARLAAIIRDKMALPIQAAAVVGLIGKTPLIILLHPAAPASSF